MELIVKFGIWDENPSPKGWLIRPMLLTTDLKSCNEEVTFILGYEDVKWNYANLP